jgi:large subunit ribosomal protein L4
VKGGAAFGPVFQDLTEKINKKLRLKAIKIVLSARLYENKVTVVESESLKYHKTRYLEAILKPYENDRILFLTGFEQDKNFMLASSNLPFLKVRNP